MAYTRGITDVHISKGALWIGSDTYPLRNIAHTSLRELHPDRNAARSRFVRRLIAKVFLLLFGLGLLQASALLGGIVVLVVVAAGIRDYLELQRVLNAPVLYVLQITTSGTPKTALTTDDRNGLEQMFRQLMEAMDNPDIQVHYQMPTYNITGGDHIYQFGDSNTGKVVTP
ncbi:DUF6232 family protein [Streptomyces bullii]|uniref:DUF6232 family protein n=1 Tax=Streptomyces bullii TaxID=349910 RepID=A0ABW0UT58_9ACTN